ncbi:uncharacterized protein LOC115424692 [Sphaeramia orbicularis]|uniref:Uncharacterized LOC115424692 n=1 Tax=Sphaeramia orbicularis TaxID=375764 RepID=A0A672ZW62_9TELE|nr:uncharacterized protein LOC115424692 [Sphaeramia orbicularis]
MDISEYVLSAGRAMLDMVEREWQPLSPVELDQRLDQAVEEILEAELLAKLRAQPPPTIYVQFIQGQENVEPQVLNTEASTSSPPEEETTESTEEPVDTVDSPTVKYITDLLQSCKSRARMAGRARLSLSHTVLLSLTLLSRRVSYRSVSTRFGLEKGNIHRIFFSFCERINTLKEGQIRWPVGQEAEEHVFPLSSLLGTYRLQDQDQSVHQVLGVLGHTRIPIRLPLGKHDVDSTVPEVKRMKKEAHPDSWINLELVCDHKGRFLHCGISKGSDVDRGMTLRDKLKLHPDMLPNGSFLVARAGYPLTAQILTPYTGNLGPKEELFNKTLEACFRTLDQAVANLKARFQRLRYLDIANYDRAKAVVLTACVLHNILLDVGKEIQADVDKEEEGLTHEEEAEVDEEGVRRRAIIADLMLKNVVTENT